MYSNDLTPEAAGAAASSNLISALAYNPYGVEQPVDSQGNLSATATWDTDWKEAILNKNAYKKQHGLSISEKRKNIFI